MLLSSPSLLTCCETINQAGEDSQTCCSDYSRDVFAYLREAEVGSLSLSHTLTLTGWGSGSLAAKGWLHAETARHHVCHAVGAGGLAG